MTTTLLGPKAGDVLGGRYILGERIGEGGMGIVFVADQPALGRTVAIKILHPRFATNRELALRFREEAVAASRVHHPSSVTVIDCNFLLDGTPYIVMEHLRGRPLGRIIAEEEIPLPRALALVGQILGALDVAHANGVVHADVKSDNFLVEQVDGADHVTMIDFGLARMDGTSEAVGFEPGTRVVSGTPEYMCPEVVRGATPTPASDLYAVGVILYELLTGSTPFGGGTTREIMARHVDEVVIPPSLRQPARNIPSILDQVVLRALAKRPEARFSDASEFARALQGALRVRDVSARWRCPTCGVRDPASARRCGTCGASAEREPSDSSSPDSPTRNCGTPIPRQRCARGSACHTTEPADGLRRAIGTALVRGDVAGIAESYTNLANALVGEQRFAAAVSELEEGIDILTAGRGTVAADVPEPLDQLVIALAALYDDARERQRVQRMS